jgi:hypothetical protein
MNIFFHYQKYMPRKSKTVEQAPAPAVEAPPPTKTPKAKAPPKHTPEQLKQLRLDNLAKARAALAKKRAEAKKIAKPPKPAPAAEAQPQ